MKKQKSQKGGLLLACFSANRIKNIFITFAIFSVSLFSQNRLPDLVYHGQTIWQLPKIAEEDIDIGIWSLILAKEYDQSVDVTKYSKIIDSCVCEIQKMLAGRTLDKDKVAATQIFLYQSGIWNGSHKFDYDLDDPTGKNPFSRLLSSYLDTRKGNCVSMPTLFYALLQRLDPAFPICGVRAPIHSFCRIKDRQTKDVYNFEATSGGTTTNVSYIEKLHIPQTAIDSGMYMRDLSKKEFLAALLEILIHKYRGKKEFHTALKYVDLALKLNPRDDIALINKCALNAELACQLQEKEKQGTKLTDKESKLFKQYSSISWQYEKKAFSLGWRMRTEEEREWYLQTVEDEKEKRSRQEQETQR